MAKKAKRSVESVGVNLEIPKLLHREVRVVAVARGLTLSEVAVEALSAWVKRSSKVAS